jgi:hypothetical protein
MSGVVFTLGVIFVVAAMAGLLKPEIFKDRKTGEVPNRWQVFFGGIMVAAVAFFIAHNSTPEPKSETASSGVQADSPVSQGPIYSSGSPDALVAATRLMEALDKTMLAGQSVILHGDLQALGAHSRLFGDLVASAKEQFGSTIYEKLGSCGIASGNARSWWQAQLAAQKDGSEPVPGAIKEFLGQYQDNRESCLESAGQVTNG